MTINNIHHINKKHYVETINEKIIDEEIIDKNFDFIKERNFIADKYGYKPWEIEFDMIHPCGEICIFVKNIWMGYVDSELKEEIEIFYSNRT